VNFLLKWEKSFYNIKIGFEKVKATLNKIIRKLKIKINKDNYENRIQNELSFYKDCYNVHELPDIFHYWSNKYLLPKQKQFGFTNPDDFFLYFCEKHCSANKHEKQIKIISVGSGNGELEIKIAKELSEKKIENFIIECMDINKDMLNRTLKLAKENNVDKYIKIITSDFNKWKPNKKNDYSIVIANQSLHHVLELEHLFNSIHQGLNKTGLFLTSDMIGKNGHMRWDEALEALEPYWEELPKEYKYNQMLKRQEKNYINHDCSTEGFEGIRAQDILELLNDRFNFKLFIPFANIIMVFVDRPFGHNFKTDNSKDLDFIDRVHEKDEELILNGTLKPTQMLAVMTKDEVSNMKLVHPTLTPRFCIRKI
jgi:SAM-dependent methyltransferase